MFVFRTDCELPEEFVSFVRLLLLPTDEWAKTAKKSKLPKPKVDRDLLAVAIDVLEQRLKGYPTTLEVRAYNLSSVAELTCSPCRTTKSYWVRMEARSSCL